MRLVTVANDGGAEFDHLARDVGVVVERQDDGNVRAEDRPAKSQLRAFDIVHALGRTCAMQMNHQRVEPASLAQASGDLLLEEQSRFRGDPAAGGGVTHFHSTTRPGVSLVRLMCR